MAAIAGIHPKFSSWVSTDSLAAAMHDVEELKLRIFSTIQDVKKNVLQSQGLQRTIESLAESDKKTDFITKKSGLDASLSKAFAKVICYVVDLENMVVGEETYEHAHCETSTLEMRAYRQKFFLGEIHFPYKGAFLSEGHEKLKDRILVPRELKVGPVTEVEKEALKDLKALLDARYPKNDDEVEPFLESVKVELNKLSSDESCKSRLVLLSVSLDTLDKVYKGKLGNPHTSQEDRRAYIDFGRQIQECISEVSSKKNGLQKIITSYFIEHMPFFEDLIDPYLDGVTAVLKEPDTSVFSAIAIKQILARLTMLSTLILASKKKLEDSEEIGEEKVALCSRFQSRIASLKDLAQVYERLAGFSRNIAAVRASLRESDATLELLTCAWHKFQDSNGLEPACLTLKVDVDRLSSDFPAVKARWNEVKGRLDEITAWLIGHVPKEEDMFAFLAATRTAIETHAVDPSFESGLYQRLQTIKQYAALYKRMFERRLKVLTPVKEGFSRNFEFQTECTTFQNIGSSIIFLCSISKRCDHLASAITDVLSGAPINVKELTDLCEQYKQLKKELAGAIESATLHSKAVPKIADDIKALEKKMMAVLSLIIKNERLVAVMQEILGLLKEDMRLGYAINVESSTFPEEMKQFIIKAGKRNAELVSYTPVLMFFKEHNPTHAIFFQNLMTLKEKKQVFDQYLSLLYVLMKGDAAGENEILAFKVYFEEGMKQIEADVKKIPSLAAVPGFTSFRENMEKGLVLAVHGGAKLIHNNLERLTDEISEHIKATVKDFVWITKAQQLNNKLKICKTSSFISKENKSTISSGVCPNAIALQNGIYEAKIQVLLASPLTLDKISMVKRLVEDQDLEIKRFERINGFVGEEYDAIKAAIAPYKDLYKERRARLQRLLAETATRLLETYRDELKVARDLKKNIKDKSLIALFTNIFSLRVCIFSCEDILKDVAGSENLQVEVQHLIWFKSVVSVSLTGSDLSKDFNELTFFTEFIELVFSFNETEKSVLEDTTPGIIKDLILAEMELNKAQIATLLRLYVEHVFKSVEVPIPEVPADAIVRLLDPFNFAIAHFSKQAGVVETKAHHEKQVAASDLLKKLKTCEFKLGLFGSAETFAPFALSGPINEIRRIKERMEGLLVVDPHPVSALAHMHRVPREHDFDGRSAVTRELPFALLAKRDGPLSTDLRIDVSPPGGPHHHRSAPNSRSTSPKG